MRLRLFLKDEQPGFATSRLTARLPTMRDYPDWARLRRDSTDHLQPWEPCWPRDHLSAPSFRRRVIWSQKSSRNDTAYPFLLTQSQGNLLVGGLTLGHVRRGPAQSCALGYWIGKTHIKKGFMTEAVAGAVRYGFDVLGFDRIEAACLPENTASITVLERCGLSQEGMVRGYLEVNGVRRDHLLYAILRDEFRSTPGNGG